MTIQEIKKALVENKNLDEVQVERVSEKIEALSPDIREAFEKWIETNDIASPEYSGYDVNAVLKAQPHMTVLAGYLTLDWIRRDPDAAIKAVKQTRYVKRIIRN